MKRPKTKQLVIMILAAAIGAAIIAFPFIWNAAHKKTEGAELIEEVPLPEVAAMIDPPERDQPYYTIYKFSGTHLIVWQSLEQSYEIEWVIVKMGNSTTLNFRITTDDALPMALTQNDTDESFINKIKNDQLSYTRQEELENGALVGDLFEIGDFVRASESNGTYDLMFQAAQAYVGSNIAAKIPLEGSASGGTTAIPVSITQYHDIELYEAENVLNEGSGNSGSGDYDKGYEDGYAQGQTAGYAAGEEAGYGSGYNSGYNEGYAAGYDEGGADGMQAGYENGYTDGKDDGYDEGYDAGYAAGEDVGHSQGQNVGYTQGYTAGLQAGYDEGYDQGYAAAEEEGYDEGYAAGYEEGYAAGHSEGYDEGFEAGKDTVYEDARNDILNSISGKVIAAPSYQWTENNITASYDTRSDTLTIAPSSNAVSFVSLPTNEELADNQQMIVTWEKIETTATDLELTFRTVYVNGAVTFATINNENMDYLMTYGTATAGTTDKTRVLFYNNSTEEVKITGLKIKAAFDSVQSYDNGYDAGLAQGNANAGQEYEKGYKLGLATGRAENTQTENFALLFPAIFGSVISFFVNTGEGMTIFGVSLWSLVITFISMIVIVKVVKLIL